MLPPAPPSKLEEELWSGGMEAEWRGETMAMGPVCPSIPSANRGATGRQPDWEATWEQPKRGVTGSKLCPELEDDLAPGMEGKSPSKKHNFQFLFIKSSFCCCFC